MEVPSDLSDELLGDLRNRLNQAASGQRIIDAAARVADLPDAITKAEQSTYAAIATAVVDAMSGHGTDDRVIVGGTANLARFGDNFESSVKPMLEALEEHVVLLKLLGEATSSNVTVRIGHEGPYDELATTSVVAAGYGPGDEALASMGVVGPTRMDYPGSMAAVRAVARYLSNILDEA